MNSEHWEADHALEVLDHVVLARQLVVVAEVVDLWCVRMERVA